MESTGSFCANKRRLIHVSYPIAFGLLAFASSQSFAQSAPPPAQTVPSLAPAASPSSNQYIIPGSAGAGSVTGQPNVSVQSLSNIPGENPNFLFNLGSYGAPIGNWLADHGVYLVANTQQGVVNPVEWGSANGGARYLCLAYWGFQVDTQQAFGMEGGFFDFRASTQSGDTATAYNSIGSEAFVPFAFGNETRLVTFAYTQSWFNHALAVELGRMQVGYTNTPYLSPGFHQSDWYCSFFSLSCGATAGFADNSSKAPYDVGTWGTAVTVHLVPISDRWYIKTGVFGNQLDEVTTNGHDGWPGRDWGFDQIRGVFIPAQLGYISSADMLYPTDFHIGGYYDNAKFTDKYLNSKFQPIATHPGAPLLDRGTSGVFGAITQTVYRFSDDPRSHRGIALFGSTDMDLGGVQTIQQQFAAGFVVTGLIPERSVDTINFLSSVSFWDPRLVEDRNTIAAINNVNYHMHPQVGFELNYGFVPTPGATIFPFAQYVINPDQLDFTIPRANLDHAVTVGIRGVFRFADIFGLPRAGGIR